MHPWSEMQWWNSGERQAAEEKIDDLQNKGVVCNPAKSLLYKALSTTKEADCRVCIVGQDPYPNAAFATGVAFSVPSMVERSNWPQTLKIILGEYHSDLGYDVPSDGDLRAWTPHVLLWNAIPSVQSGRPLSNDWDEWKYLTKEIIDRLSKRGIVFAFLGGVARSFADGVDLTRNRVILTSHPSPRGIRNSRTPFTGSRLFSTINARLRELNLEPIDWELKDGPSESVLQPTSVVRGTGVILPNINRVDLGRPPRARLPRRASSTFSVEVTDAEVHPGSTHS